MARTYQQVRRLTASQTGLLWTYGTADTGGSTTTLVDATLSKYSNDQLNGHHILLTDGTPTYTELFITKFFQSDGDAVFRPEESAAPDSLAYEILPFSGTDFLRSIQDAILQLYDVGLLARDFWMRVVGGSPIYNADFSYWISSSAVDGWTVTDASVARERASSNITLSETSVRLHTAAGHLDLDAQWQRYLNDFKGSTVTLHCWVKTAVGSNARIAIYDGSTINYSAYHGGDGDWELLTVEVNTANTDTEFEPRLYVDTSSEAYFNMPFLSGGALRVRSYPIPHQIMPDGPTSIQLGHLEIQEDEIASGRGLGTMKQLGRQIRLMEYDYHKHHDENTTSQVALLDLSQSRRPPSDGTFLLLRGDGPLTVPTSALSTDSIEVTESESLLLAKVSAINLLERAAAGAPSSTRRTYGSRLAEMRSEVSELAESAGEARNASAYSLNW